MKRKLIEVALPLEAINIEAAREKSIHYEHPSTLHLWWSRKPLAACRAVLFASLVDDPSSRPDRFPTEEAQKEERQRLFRLIERLVKWENSHDESLYREAWEEILKSTDGNPPPVLDPFAGGGSIPLEAQRLGLEAHASDLNPVAVLINKALIEIPPKFAKRPPVNPQARAKINGASVLKGAVGLAEDIRYYGRWMRERAFERIGHLYPTVTVPAAVTVKSREATVIAWLWARTVPCPNPACGARMPLLNSYWLSKKKGKETWANPKLSADKKSVQFELCYGKEAPPGTVNRNGAQCICCGAPVPLQHIRDEGRAGRMSAQLMAIVVEGVGGRSYLSPNDAHIKAADLPKPKGYPDGVLYGKLAVSAPLYGMKTFSDLFSPRQLTALSTFSELVDETIAEIEQDARSAMDSKDERGLDEGGAGAKAYAQAVAVYLACAIDKGANMWSTACSWMTDRGAMRETFTRQAIPMIWDYAEANPFSNASGSFITFVERVASVINSLPIACKGGFSIQNHVSQISNNAVLISTDPPYYDNIGYADLADFFYIWLRRSLRNVYPSLFSTMLVPKAEELVATPYRFGGNRKEAKAFFESGMLQAFKRMRGIMSQDYPLTVYYAYKQTESKSTASETASSGWETMLQAIINSGFVITGTWTLRTEMMSRAVAMNTNALASSIAIVCRPRLEDAPSITRRVFQSELREALKTGLHNLQSGNIAPVDFAQASIGPGIAVYSKYKEIVEADGSLLTVRQALVLINKELDAFISEQSGNLDGESRFCIAWFEQYGFQDGPYGEANTLMRARMASEQKLKDSGIVQAKQGKVRLVRHGELDLDLFLQNGNGESMVWAVVQHLCHALEAAFGLERCAALMAKLSQETTERAKALSYRIYQICGRKALVEEALAYNNLVTTWDAFLRGQTPRSSALKA